MKLELVDIRERIGKGEISAVSLDTSIFHRNALNLEHDLLPRLEQFRNTKIRIVISDVVHAEVLRHLIENAAEAQEKASISIKKMARTWGVEQAISDHVTAPISGGMSPEACSESRWNKFVRLIGAEIQNGSRVNVSDLFERYMKARPPFENKADKKHEFPDAIALLTLESWAAENNLKMLIVSADGGWQRFCEQSLHLVHVQDLSLALSLFQSEANQHDVRCIARSISAGDPLKVVESVYAALGEQAACIDFDVDADSQFSYDFYIGEVDVEWIDESALSCEESLVLVEASPDGGHFVVSVTVPVEYRVEVCFDFHKWDGIDREYIPMGDVSLRRKAAVDVEVLIQLDKERGDFSISQIDVIGTRVRVRCGEVEPDWMGAPD